MVVGAGREGPSTIIKYIPFAIALQPLHSLKGLIKKEGKNRG